MTRNAAWAGARNAAKLSSAPTAVTVIAAIQRNASEPKAWSGDTYVESARLARVSASAGASQAATRQSNSGRASAATAASAVVVASTAADRISSSRKLRSGAATPIS
ncbi:MAG: hypothetical protein KY396_04275 [Actinobacteria bacterium]|nr:hypothetical protein [Actinomycetota bacterium]